MKSQINSIFTRHFNDLMEITNSEDLKNRVLEIVNGSSIKPLDKRKIILDITPLGTTKSLQVYLTNSMLKYSGLGVR